MYTIHPEVLFVDELQRKELPDEEEGPYFTMEDFFFLYSVLVLVNIWLAICARIHLNIGTFIPI